MVNINYLYIVVVQSLQRKVNIIIYSQGHHVTPQTHSFFHTNKSWSSCN